MEIPETIRERVLREVIDTAPFPIGVYTGHKMKIVLANKCMIDTYGKGPDVIGKYYTEILPELENQEIFDQLREVLVTGKAFEAKNSRVDIVIDGQLKPHYFNYNFTPIFGENNEVYGVMNTAAEVTELNVSKQQTIETEKRLRLAVESSQMGTFEIDILTGTITGSKRFLSFFDSVADKFNLVELQRCVSLEDQNTWMESIQQIYNSGNLQCEIRIKYKDTVRWIRFSGTSSESDNKENIIVGIAQDITEQKQYSEDLLNLVEKRTSELRRSNDDLKQFGHVISHDLKEPIRKISMFSNLLQESINTNQIFKADQYTKKIKKSSSRITDMIDSILNYSASEIENINEIVDLNVILQGILEDLEVKILEKKAVIKFEKMPVIFASSILMHQLFYNLINNSLKFSRLDTDPIIIIDSMINDDKIILKISDNGIGINVEDSQRIFNTFEKLHSKNEYEGTGLGLALCKKIVERHKGEIRNVFTEDHGANFEMIFPLDILNK